MFNVGDKVRIRDGSWTRKYIDGEHVGTVHAEDHDEVYTVLTDHPINVIESSKRGMDVKPGEWAFERARCTTVIQKDTTVIFINRAFLELAVCPTCGNLIAKREEE